MGSQLIDQWKEIKDVDISEGYWNRITAKNSTKTATTAIKKYLLKSENQHTLAIKTAKKKTFGRKLPTAATE